MIYAPDDRCTELVSVRRWSGAESVAENRAGSGMIVENVSKRHAGDGGGVR